jgi:hypothetical protein
MDFDYTLVTAYLPKGIRAVRTQLDKIMTLKFSDFNLWDHKNHIMLTHHRYLTRMKGTNSRIIPQPWTMKPHVVHYLECDEDTTFWKAPGS